MTEEINAQRKVGRPPGKKEAEEAGSVLVERPKKHEPKEATVLGKNPVSAVTGQSRILIFVGIALCACILLLAAVIVLQDANFPQVGGSVGNRIYPLANESGEPDLQATVDALQGQIEAGTYSAIPQPREVAPVVKGVVPTNTPVAAAVEETCFPEVGRIAPKPLKNGEWLYDCLSAGHGNWVMQSDEWRLANWKKGKDAYEIVNIVIPDGAATLGLGCIPCTVLTPSGETVSPTDTDFGPFDPNISLPVIPGEVYKVRTFGAEECSVTDGPCPPSVSIWFNVGASSQTNGPVRFASKAGIPDGSIYTAQVNPGELHLFTAGPVCVLGTCLSGGETRASVIAMQSLDSSYSVELSGLVAYSNWYGAYKAEPEFWDGLINATVDGMKKPGNCSNGKVCEIIDVIIIDAGAIVKREVR